MHGDDVELLSVKRVAALLSVSPRQVWRLAAVGDLPQPLRLGTKTVRWRLSAIRAYLADLEKKAQVSC